MGKRKKKRLNINFRQTAKAFKEARQTKIFSNINRNIPYTAYNFSRKLFKRKVKDFYQKTKDKKEKIPSFAKRIKQPKKKK